MDIFCILEFVFHGIFIFRIRGLISRDFYPQILDLTILGIFIPSFGNFQKFRYFYIWDWGLQILRFLYLSQNFEIFIFRIARWSVTTHQKVAKINFKKFKPGPNSFGAACFGTGGPCWPRGPVTYLVQGTTKFNFKILTFVALLSVVTSNPHRRTVISQVNIFIRRHFYRWNFDIAKKTIKKFGIYFCSNSEFWL